MENITRTFRPENIAIVYISSVGYIPILNVSLCSLIDHCCDRNTYDIVILGINVDRFDRAAIKRLAKAKENISIRFFEPIDMVKKWVPADLNVEEYRFYYRALLPWIMNEYDRILYLGADTIIKTDVAQLCHEIIPTKKTILASLKKDGMDLDVMLMDVKGICERIKQSTMIRQLHICANNECLAYEKVFDNMIHPLAQEWNVQPLHVRDEMEIDTVRETAKIIHYKRMPKPWINPLMMMAEDWWAIARRTEYYEEILRRMSRFEPDNRSGVRVVLDEVFPKGTKRREIVKCIIKPFGRKEQ